MQLTDAQVKKFQLLYKKRFFIDLSEQEAKEKGIKLITYVQKTLKPLPRTKLKPIAEMKLETIEQSELKPLPPQELPTYQSG